MDNQNPKMESNSYYEVWENMNQLCARENELGEVIMELEKKD